eukprot:3922152-Prymnesium_polylepis.1
MAEIATEGAGSTDARNRHLAVSATDALSQVQRLARHVSRSALSCCGCPCICRGRRSRSVSSIRSIQ